MRSIVTVGVAVFIALGLATTGVAQTTYYACVLKDGTIRMVSPDQSCRRNETLISWSGGPSGAGPAVWDSSTPPQRVGFSAAAGAGTQLQSVLFEREGTWFFADITKDGFRKNGPGLTYWNLTCSGEPYIEGSYGYLPTLVRGISNAMIGYYATGDPVPIPPPADPPGPNASARYGEPDAPCYQFWLSGGTYFQVGTIDLAGFTPPFYLKQRRSRHRRLSIASAHDGTR